MRKTKTGGTDKPQSGGTYQTQTREIDVTVEPVFLEEQSSPSENHYVWAYHIRITNEGEHKVQLMNRHWEITDAMGRRQEVKGAGVVGKQPVLQPGESFEYTSGTPLSTPSGIMVGEYQMEGESGEQFTVRIPAFSLDSPHQPIRPALTADVGLCVARGDLRAFHPVSIRSPARSDRGAGGFRRDTTKTGFTKSVDATLPAGRACSGRRASRSS